CTLSHSSYRLPLVVLKLSYLKLIHLISIE
ncbi:hypothetical protein Gotur_018143, partial [Gossypium turneri]